MKQSLTSLFTALVFLLFNNNTNAQVPEAWQTDLGSNILWQEVTDLGNLIVCTQKSLMGIDPETGNKSWELADYGGINRNQYKPLNGSPYVSISTDLEQVLVETFTGKIVFDTHKAGLFDVKTQYFLYKNGGILIYGNSISANLPMMVMVDMYTGKVLWENLENFGRLINVQSLSADEILVITLFDTYKMNAKSGDVIWKNANSSESAQLDDMGALGQLAKTMAENMVSDDDINISYHKHPNKDMYIIGAEQKSVAQTSTGQETITYNTLYTAFNTTDGSMTWPKAAKMKGKLGTVAFHADGVIIFPDDGNKTKINMYDYATGEGKWGKKGKGIGLKGSVYAYTFQNDGVLVVTQTESKNFLNFLDPVVGELTFDKPVRIKGSLVYTEYFDKNLVYYLTTEELNVLNISTGELKLSKSIPTKPGLTLDDDTKVYTYDTKENVLKEMEKSSLRISNISPENIKFDGKEKPVTLEFREGGYLLSSDQNMAKINYNKQIEYQQYYPAPREPGLKRALLYAQAIRAAYIGANSKYTAGVMNAAVPEVAKEDETMGMIVDELGTAYNDLGDAAVDYAKDAWNAASARFKATTAGRDFVIVFAAAEGKDNQLVKVNKDTGEEEGFISLGREKEPEYAVDDITGQVFYKTGSTVITSYKF